MVIAAAQLTVSFALVFWASLSRGQLPLWPRLLDIALAFSVVITAGLLHARAGRVPAAQRLPKLRIALLVDSTVPSGLTLGVWLLRERLDWNILLPGLAWRLFILLYGISAALTLWRSRAP